MNKNIENHLEHNNIDTYIGGDQENNYYILMYQEKERKFVVTHNTNIKPVAYFIGREKELYDLRQKIENGQKAILVSGMGGIGKTHICKKLFEEYVEQHRQGKEEIFHYVGYVEYNENIGVSLQRCLRYKKQDNPKMDREAAWKELEYLAADGKLLLFIDNVNVSIEADPELKRLTNIPGAIILTSRRTLFSKEFEPYQIGFLSTERCKEIYEKIRFENSGIKVAQEEIQELEYIIEKLAARHTISIEFIANLALTKKWTVKELKEKLEKNGFQLEYKDEEDKLINIQKSYETLYNLSELNKAERNILEAFSVFPYIPLAAGICNQWLLLDAKVEEKEDILVRLYRKGWLQFDIQQESYSLHPVFAQFIYEKCKPEMEEHCKLVEACKNSLQIPDNGSVLKCQKYIPFAENILEKIVIEKNEKQVKFIGSLACLYCYMAEYSKAEELYERISRIAGNILGEEHPYIASNYNELAIVYRKQGKYKKAEELYWKSLQIRKKVLGEEQLDTAISYDNLAILYEEQGKYRKAKELYEKSLRIKERVLGREHLDIATSYHNLAGIYRIQGEYKKAEELYKKSLKIRKILGEENLFTARSYNNLAVVYEEQGKYKIAEELYKKSLQIREKMLGKEHPDTMVSYNNLAGVYGIQGKYKKAESLYEKSLQIVKKVLGEEHPFVARSYNNLGVIYKKQGEYNKAEELYRKSIEIREKVLGKEHPNTATSYNNLAVVYVEQGEYKKAKELYEKSLWIREKILGKQHPLTAASYNNLAKVYERQGKYKEAEELYGKSLWIKKKILGEEHLDTAISYDNFAGLYEKKGEYKKAKELYKNSLRIKEKILGGENPDTAISYHNLAGLYNIQGEYKKAEEMYKKSLWIREKVLGKEHPDTAVGYNDLAVVYGKQGEYKMALLFYTKAYKILVLKLGLNYPNTQIVYNNLKEAYTTWSSKNDFNQC